MYSCRCGITCTFSSDRMVTEKPHVHLFVSQLPDGENYLEQPVRAYLYLEADVFTNSFFSNGEEEGSRIDREEGLNIPDGGDGVQWERGPSGVTTWPGDVLLSYKASADVQVTYAGEFYQINRQRRMAIAKRDNVLVYVAVSHCGIRWRDRLLQEFMQLVPTHSFGKCENNVGGQGRELKMYPHCRLKGGSGEWFEHAHCVMSHYKFVLAAENTVDDSYVTEKLFYALESNTVPIYFGAKNAINFAPPRSFIDSEAFESVGLLAEYVMKLAADPIKYSEYLAWRRCGVLGNYARARAVSLDTAPCRLCEFVSSKGYGDVPMNASQET
ncbi:hypothetical protein CBR_g41226 [Chara braunii]|uniref:Fucosyltransferase n=1 Tax=Chara braunii TaxID=69332 RepID=A0A388K2Q6_CHABU|nr:hypothetical protein CBR_g41226 [Chara braunii]|eukprot:GBG64307.1 hypothetical protein CBR_g41226 [Chara braunii]